MVNDLKAKAEQPSPVVSMIRAGRDEMNLVEYPFAGLAKHGGAAEIEQVWETKHPLNGRPLQARWRVIGDPKMGLPTSYDERVYLVLMELTKEQGFKDLHVSFTRYDLLKRLGWPPDKKHYDMIYDAFKRLQAVKITAENAFWDPKARSFRNVGFSLIGYYDIVAARPGRKKKSQPKDLEHETPELALSTFRWDEVVFESARNGYLKTLDLGFALSLNSPIALRLYRYLDKKKHGENDHARYSFQIELHRLCELHLGMTPQRFVSTLKSRLQDAHNELMARGFIKSVTYLPMRSRAGEKVIYVFGERPLPLAEASPSRKTPRTTQEKDAEVLGQACDAALASLPEDERAAIEQEARAGWPDFMLDRLEDQTSIAAKEHHRVMREIVQRDHAEEVQKCLRKS